MKTASRVIIALVVIAMMTATVITAVVVFDIGFHHFEDGSGCIGYCLPWELCGEEYQIIEVERRRK